MENLVKGCVTAMDVVSAAMLEDDARLEKYESSIEAFVKSIIDPAPVDRTPFRNKKKPKRQSNLNEDDETTRSSSASTTSNTTALPELMPAPSGRIPRKAAEEARKGLKEVDLSRKMRNETVKIKTERVSSDSVSRSSRVVAPKPTEPTVTVESPQLDEQIATVTARLSIHEHANTAAAAPADKPSMDESIIEIPNVVDEVVMLSDGESDATESMAPEQRKKSNASVVMPPPPSKPITRTKTRTKKVKEEPIEADPLPSVRSTRSKKPKNVPVPKAVVKKEVICQAPAEPMLVDEVVADKVVTAANVTTESVYEDAREALPKVASPAVAHMPMVQAGNSTFVQPGDSTFVQPGNSTFVQPGNSTFVQPGNQTFVHPGNSTFVQPPNDTYVASGINNVTTVLPNETFQMNATTTKATMPNETMVIESNGPQRANPSMSSIMTDDISDDECSPKPRPLPKPQLPPVRSTNKHHKELFNPCVQSPMKKKVEAFERHAASADAHSPVDQPNADRGTARSLLRQPSTPKVADIIKNLKSFTPNDVKRIPNAMSASVGGNSTSKLAHLNRPASASKASAVRDSAEDIKKSLLEQADEKKRKREEKLKQVQLQREAREKEKADKLKKQMLEKEEKMRQEAEKKRLLKERKDRDAESKRNLEEIQRNIKIQEKKNAERAKLEREMADAARREREQIDQQRILVEKNVMQQKLKLNQLQKQKTSKYNFQMLNTDDETDDDEQNGNQNRPQPPNWSLRGYREDRITSQSNLKLNTIDIFFSSKPTTPDLKEIFPEIQDKYLKRNSSAVWNTPPRYSTMNVPRY